MMKTYVFDLDDVVASFNSELCKVLADTIGDPKVLTDHLRWSQYELEPHYPQITDFQSIFMEMFDRGMIATLPVKRHTATLIKAIRDRGDRVTILTARGWIPNAHKVTEAWFDTNGVEVDEIIVSPYRSSKRESFPKNVYAYIDDNAKHVIDCAPLCEGAFVFNKPWNCLINLPEGIFRINDPEDFGVETVVGSTWLLSIDLAIRDKKEARC